MKIVGTTLQYKPLIKQKLKYLPPFSFGRPLIPLGRGNPRPRNRSPDPSFITSCTGSAERSAACCNRHDRACLALRIFATNRRLLSASLGLLLLPPGRKTILPQEDVQGKIRHAADLEKSSDCERTTLTGFIDHASGQTDTKKPLPDSGMYRLQRDDGSRSAVAGPERSRVPSGPASSARKP